jgi:hypothetical protein
MAPCFARICACTGLGSVIDWQKQTKKTLASDGILGHQFNKRLESFAPCYSHYPLGLYWRILKKTILFSAFKNPYKKSESIHE